LKACIHAQLDHAAQPIPVVLEQVRQRLAVARPEPLHEMEGIARIVRHELGGQRRGDRRLPYSPPVTG
jgi:hypothetical protein